MSTQQDTDRIEREVLVEAPIDRVWEIITAPQHVGLWFGDEAKIDLRVGGAISFGWKDHGWFNAVVVALEPPNRFVWRWCLEANEAVDEGPTTRVEFRLTPEGAATRLLVVETGFDSLDPEIRDRRRRDNTAGWQQELDKLLAYVRSGPAA